MFLEVYISYEPSCLSSGWLVGQSVRTGKSDSQHMYSPEIPMSSLLVLLSSLKIPSARLDVWNDGNVSRRRKFKLELDGSTNWLVAYQSKCILEVPSFARTLMKSENNNP